MKKSQRYFSFMARKNTMMALCCVLLLVSACSSVPPVQQSPSFSGPWAAQFEQAYESASNPTAKEALKDGVLTDMEVSEIRQEQISCLESLGCTVTELNTDGSASITPPQHEGESFDEIQQTTAQLSSQCETQTDWSMISYLYTAVHTNPENQDTYSLMAECLVRVGLEDEGYTAAQYQSDLESGLFLPYIQNQDTEEGQAFMRCNLDPTNAR